MTIKILFFFKHVVLLWLKIIKNKKMFSRRKLVFIKDKNHLVYLTRRAIYTYLCHNFIIYRHCDNITLFYINIVFFAVQNYYYYFFTVKRQCNKSYAVILYFIILCNGRVPSVKQVYLYIFTRRHHNNNYCDSAPRAGTTDFLKKK